MSGYLRDPDVRLMLAAKEGDEGAFLKLYDKHKLKLMNFGRRFLGNQSLAEEATQDVFLKIFEARGRYRPAAKFTTYLYRAMTNHCINLSSKHEHTKRAHGVDGADVAVQGATQERRAANRQALMALQKAIAKLPEQQRAALLLCHYDHLSQQDAAQALGVSVGTVKSLIHRGRQSLSAALSEHREPSMEAAVHA